MKEWEDFGNTAPSSLAHVPQDQRTTFEDFSACATTEPIPSAKEVEQQELVEWKDTEKQGRGSSKGKLGKERIERKQLKLADVAIGSFILTLPDEEDDYGSPHQNTIFNLAKVTSHIDDTSIQIWWFGSSSIRSSQQTSMVSGLSSASLATNSPANAEQASVVRALAKLENGWTLFH